MTAIPVDATPARRTPRWLIVVVATSLLLNGLVLGAIGTRLLGGHAGPPSWIASSDNAHLFGLAFTLPRERYREIRLLVEDQRAAMRPLREKRARARESVSQALVAQPFDLQRFSEAQRRLFDAEQETRLGTLKVVAAMMQHLTPDERAALAKWESDDRNKRRQFWREMRESDKQK